MTKLKRSIALVGLMGAGKSSVGRRLAELLKVRFVDTDDEIVAAAGMTIPDVFERFGEPEFRDLERRVITRVMQEAPAVVATGGGAFMQPAIRDAIASAGASVWLKVDLELLWHRVQEKPGRPLLATANPYATLKSLLEERQPVYKLADVTVEAHKPDSQTDIAKDVIRGLIGFGRDKPDRAVFEHEATL